MPGDNVTLINRLTREIRVMDHRDAFQYRGDDRWEVDPPGMDDLVARNVPQRYWKIVNRRAVELDEEEKPAAFIAARDAKNEEFSLQTLSFIAAAGYDQPAQMFMNALLTDAYGTGKANRATYLTQALQWIAGCYQMYAMVRDAVNGSTTDGMLDAITLDLSPMSALDPHVTIEGAIAIPD